jgi:hypothetical protein
MAMIDAQLAVPVCAGVVLRRQFAANVTSIAALRNHRIILVLSDAVPMLDPVPARIFRRPFRDVLPTVMQFAQASTVRRLIACSI